MLFVAVYLFMHVSKLSEVIQSDVPSNRHFITERYQMNWKQYLKD